MDNLIDGRAIAHTLQRALKTQVAELHKKGVRPTLINYHIGHDPSAEIYFNAKRKLAEALDVTVYCRRYEEIEEAALIRQIENCNQNREIDGICIELPLPPSLDAERVRRAVAPEKDVDGINPTNLGRLILGESLLPPATPMSVIELLHATGISCEGQDVVIVGRSDVVGIPLSLLLERRHATVTVCHSKTKALSEKTRRADILCVAVGRPRYIRGDMVQEGAVVVDIGVNVTEDGLVGDVAFDEVQPKARWITPVPGGVGPMAATLVMKNVIQSARRRL